MALLIAEFCAYNHHLCLLCKRSKEYLVTWSDVKNAQYYGVRTRTGKNNLCRILCFSKHRFFAYDKPRHKTRAQFHKVCQHKNLLNTDKIVLSRNWLPAKSPSRLHRCDWWHPTNFFISKEICKAAFSD